MAILPTDTNRYKATLASPPEADVPAPAANLSGVLAQVASQSLTQTGGDAGAANDSLNDFLNQALGISTTPKLSSTDGLLSIPDGEGETSDWSSDLFGDSSSLDSSFTNSSSTTTSTRDVSDPALSAGESESSQTIASLYPSGGTPQIADINQGALGDCYALAPLASMAATTQGQAAIKQAIEPIPSTPPTYDVHMYSPEGKPVTVSVDGSTVNDGVKGSDGQSNWASVMEKAWAKYNDTYQVNKNDDGSATKGYAGIGNGGFSSDVYQALTGKAAIYSAEFNTNGSVADPSEVSQQLKDQLNKGQSVTAYSNLGPAGGVEGQDPIATTAGGSDVIGGHAYAVLGTDGNDVILRNPWGKNGSANAGANQNPPGVIRMSMDEFVKDFRYTIASGT